MSRCTFDEKAITARTAPKNAARPRNPENDTVIGAASSPQAPGDAVAADAKEEREHSGSGLLVQVAPDERFVARPSVSLKEMSAWMPRHRGA
jgi:hypothetical protein